MACDWPRFARICCNDLASDATDHDTSLDDLLKRLAKHGPKPRLDARAALDHLTWAESVQVISQHDVQSFLCGSRRGGSAPRKTT